MSVTDHDTVGGVARGRERGGGIGDRVRARASRSPPCTRVATSTCSATSSIAPTRRSPGFSRSSAPIACGASSAWPTSLPSMGKPVDREALLASRPTRQVARPAAGGEGAGQGRACGRRAAGVRSADRRRQARVHAAVRRRPLPTVIAIISRAGGVASLAHPGLLKRDDLIPAMVDAGLTAVEAFHSEHDAATTERYLALAERHGILVSGGSDYHGEKERRQSGVRHGGAAARSVRAPCRARETGRAEWRRRCSRRLSRRLPASARPMYLGLTVDEHGRARTAHLDRHLQHDDHAAGALDDDVLLPGQGQSREGGGGRRRALERVRAPHRAGAQAGIFHRDPRDDGDDGHRARWARASIRACCRLACTACWPISCLALNLGALRVEISALTESGRVVAEVNQLLG